MECENIKKQNEIAKLIYQIRELMEKYGYKEITINEPGGWSIK